MTVIELVVVVALLGVMAGLVASSFASFDRRPADTRATQAIDAFIRRGRSTAIERATVVSITIDPAGKRFWLEPPDTTAVLTLPNDATLVSRARRVHIRIEPDGEVAIDEALFVRDPSGTLPVAVGR